MIDLLFPAAVSGTPAGVVVELGEELVIVTVFLL